MRTIFHWWMERCGCQLVHGAGVARRLADGQGRALLLVGKGGVGKSSTALTCLEQGLGFLGDDYVIVRPGKLPMIYSLYATAKLNRADVDRYPGYREHLYREPTGADEKAVVMLYPAFADQLCREMPLAAMAMPRVVDRETTTFLAESASVLQQAATFTTMAQLPYAGDASHQAIARLCASIDGYRIELGRDKAGVAQAIATCLDAAATRTPGERATVGDGSRAVEAAVLPLLSVIIPTWNGARFVADAVNSVVAQGYPALEIIIVDDGSTDDTEAVVRSLPIEVHYFKQENLGPAWARNRGIRDAAGDYLAFLDIDDLFAEGALMTLMHALLADPALDIAQGYSQVTEYVPESDSFEYRGSPTESFP